MENADESTDFAWLSERAKDRFIRTRVHGVFWAGLGTSIAGAAVFLLGGFSGSSITGALLMCGGLCLSALNLAGREAELRRTQQRLGSSDMLQASIDCFPGGMSVFDDNQVLVAYSKDYFDFIGLPQDKFGIGSRAEDVVRYLAEHGEYGAGEIEAAIANRLAYMELRDPHKFERYAPDGRTFEIQRNPLGERGFVTSYLDVTERKAQESALLQAKLEAESAAKVAEELAQEAKAASRMKSEFLATMSHEIRTPMNGVIGGAALLGTTELTADQKSHLGIIHMSATGLMTLLNDILDISKIESGRMVLESIEFDLKDFLENACAAWRNLGGDVSFDLTVDPLLPASITGDPTRLRQIVVNLLDNAFKFTKKGSVSLKVFQQKRDKHNVVVRFEIQDSGIGVPETAQPLLFEKFTQADASTTRKHGGTGLGLAICKELCLMMGGEIGCDSKDGEGATFWFTVKSELDAQVNVSAKQDADAIVLPPLKILAAEDSDINQKIITTLLEREGHTVEIVCNGLEAIEAVRQRSYDVVLMDIHMPELDGLAATERIRQLDGPAAGIPIIALTADAMIEHRQACIDAGMNEHLAKPIILPKLMQKIAAVTQLGNIADFAPVAGNTMDEGQEKGGAIQANNSKPLGHKEINLLTGSTFAQDQGRQPETPVISESAFAELADMVGWDVLGSLFEKLIAEITTHETLMPQTATIAELGQQAHTFKSTLGQFGAVRAQKIAIEMDTLCKAGQEDAARQLIPAFFEACHEAIDALRGRFEPDSSAVNNSA